MLDQLEIKELDGVGVGGFGPFLSRIAAVIRKSASLCSLTGLSGNSVFAVTAVEVRDIIENTTFRDTELFVAVYFLIECAIFLSLANMLSSISHQNFGLICSICSRVLGRTNPYSFQIMRKWVIGFRPPGLRRLGKILCSLA